MSTIYKTCPTFENEKLKLVQTTMEDAQELLQCYADQKAVPFFNSDNCNGDIFYYPTIERMKEAIEFWEKSYGWNYFVRWTVSWKSNNEKIGTIEMFNRGESEHLGVHGILRIDLRSQYETQDVVENILKIANQEFYREFEVTNIITKAIPSASQRIQALKQSGYEKLGEGKFLYQDYYERRY